MDGQFPASDSSSHSSAELEEIWGREGQGAILVFSDQPMALEIVEGAENERYCPGTAEPAHNSVLWLISEDNEQKWWQECHPDFATALELQHTRGEAEATICFFPRAMGVCYTNYKYFYIHDLAHMIQVDLNLHETRSLRRVQLVAGHQPDAGTGGQAPASKDKEAATQGTAGA